MFLTAGIAVLALAAGWLLAHLHRRGAGHPPVATVTHELRTPISGMIGMTDLLLATELTPEQTTYVRALRGSAEAMRALTDDLLDAAAMDAGRFHPASAAFAPAALVEEIVELLAPHAQAKGLEIAGFVAPDVAFELEGDVARLRQILLNLTSNAVKYTSHGGVGLRADATPDGVVFSVHDTGPGISVPEMNRLFDWFTRGGAADRASGTGLGLAITRRLVARLGGRLDVRSEPGKGSTFSAAVPLTVRTASLPSRHLDGERVLIAMHSVFEGPWLAEAMAAEGAEVVLADGNEVATHLANEDWTVVISDEAGRSAMQHTGRMQHHARRVVHLLTPGQRRVMGEAERARLGSHLMRPVRLGSLHQLLTAPLRATSFRAPDRMHMETHGASRRPRALVVEDDAVNALLARTRLELAGWSVTVAADGQDGIDAFADALAGQRYGLVVLDLQLPRRSGREVAEAIRALERQHGCDAVPVVVVTATPERIVAEGGCARLFDAVTEKPLDPRILADILDRRDRTAV